MMKKSVAMLAVCMLAQSHLAISPGPPCPPTTNFFFSGPKAAPSFPQKTKTPQHPPPTLPEKKWGKV
ncbi:MBL fold metallo-hydrolase, partial [Salmonella enterica subsp. enterica serovar Anatum]